ncbi:MAG: aspartate carbamoyltransferase regulatory subunit, partial [Oscillospiraceae bacterium]
KHTVAFLMNATSKANGHKDVIKIDAVNDVDLNVLGLIDPNCTVNIIKNGKIVEKIRPEMPKVVKNVIKCKNPRCVTSVESGAPQIFHLINEATGEYRCEYCDEIISMEEDDIHEILHP